ncbi:hypothetical protein H696_01119 [Fonticula alba]|uniref:Prenyltransferase alpha-alpha toroid domain-containing protein n=1 Tax=Fonticula alba TaxID=691883 RepID=A0A058ZCN0_FONAL|nr:hypothetical protein H696_01119 [Fonticula alba]KCV71696.1 hypothetical protein H696_01119 [Fonticula alba]|eukprot:XP_009493274.1 hypothetical protein H696_01119 [Fonticula alba]
MPSSTGAPILKAPLGVEKHRKYFDKCLLGPIPHYFATLEPSRMSLVFFLIGGMAITDSLESLKASGAGTAVADWIYMMQVEPTSENGGAAGFRSSSVLGCGEQISSASSDSPIHTLDTSHITMTYCALAALAILGDDFSRVNRAAIVQHLRSLQREDGSFQAVSYGPGMKALDFTAPGPDGQPLPGIGDSEYDMRFLFSACAVSWLLDDWSGIDQVRALEYIRQSYNYDGGFGQGPFLESHGGSTFCALASLSLMGKLDEALPDRDHTIQWLIHRQLELSYNGRPHKDEDSCYSFWVGSSIELLESGHLPDHAKIMTYLSKCQSVIGGLSSSMGGSPDPIHSYLGLCGWHLCQKHLGSAGVENLDDAPADFPLISIDTSLDMPLHSVEHMKKLHAQWKKQD